MFNHLRYSVDLYSKERLAEESLRICHFINFFNLTTFGGERSVVGCSVVAALLGRKRFVSCDVFCHGSFTASTFGIGTFYRRYVS